MQTNFKIDKEFDAYVVWENLRDTTDPAGRYSRAEGMGLTAEQADRIAGYDAYEKVKDYLEGIADERYRLFGEGMKEPKQKLENAWPEINNNFFPAIRELTNLEWEFDEYTVYVSNFHGGTAPDAGEDTLCIFAWTDVKVATRTLAHEFMMGLFYQTISVTNSEAGKDEDGFYFAVYEILGVLLVEHANEEYKWWDEKTNASINLSNYPEYMRTGLTNLRASLDFTSPFTQLFDLALTEVKRQMKYLGFKTQDKSLLN